MPNNSSAFLGIDTPSYWTTGNPEQEKLSPGRQLELVIPPGVAQACPDDKDPVLPPTQKDRA